MDNEPRGCRETVLQRSSEAIGISLPQASSRESNQSFFECTRCFYKSTYWEWKISILPGTLDILCGTTFSISIVISPLVALMKEQVEKLREKGTRAIYTGDLVDEEHEAVRRASEYQFVFTSPETILVNSEWRALFMRIIWLS